MIPLGALIRLEVVRGWRGGGIPLALLLFSLLHGLGWAFGLGADRLFGYAYLAGLGVGLRPGLTTDRTGGYGALVAVSLASPLRFAVAKLTGALSGCLALSLWSVGFAVVAAGGDWGFGLWYGALFSAVALLCVLPAVVLDLALGVRLPALPAYLLALLVALLALGAGVEPGSLQEWAGLAVIAGTFTSLTPALVRGAVGVTIALLVIWRSFVPAGSAPTTRLKLRCHRGALS